jgi:hypothetical protein
LDYGGQRGHWGQGQRAVLLGFCDLLHLCVHAGCGCRSCGEALRVAGFGAVALREDAFVVEAES